jgi:hypothetical protein
MLQEFNYSLFITKEKQQNHNYDRFINILEKTITVYDKFETLPRHSLAKRLVANVSATLLSQVIKNMKNTYVSHLY